MKVKLETMSCEQLRKIGASPIQRTEFPPEHSARIKALWERVKGYGLYATLEQWELGFMRDRDYMGEVVFWEQIATATERCVAALALDQRVCFLAVFKYMACAAMTTVEKATSPNKDAIAICRKLGFLPRPLVIHKFGKTS